MTFQIDLQPGTQMYIIWAHDVKEHGCWVSRLTSQMCRNRRKEAAERRRSCTLSDWRCCLINHIFNKTHLFHPAPIMEVVAYVFISVERSKWAAMKGSEGQWRSFRWFIFLMSIYSVSLFRLNANTITFSPCFNGNVWKSIYGRTSRSSTEKGVKISMSTQVTC